MSQKHLKICPKCQQPHSANGRFCSYKCSNSRVWSEAINKSRSQKALARKPVQDEPRFCTQCGTQVFRRKNHKFPKTCSKPCALQSKLQSRSLRQHEYKKAPGGLREGSGRGKSGWYNGMYLHSTYELAYVIYCQANNISIERCSFVYEYIWEGKLLHYHPDFLINNSLIIETKGFHTPQVEAKKNAVTDYPILVLYKKDLGGVFAFVERLTGKGMHNLHTLYDDHKPRFTYSCDTCNNMFESTKPRLKDTKFCSQSCAGKYGRPYRERSGPSMVKA